MNLFLHRIGSPLGELTMTSDGEAITGLWLPQCRYAPDLSGAVERDLPVFSAAEAWLNRYFSGRDPGAPPPLAPRGSDYQMQVWAELRRIPFGQTISYGELARRLAVRIGRRTSARAAGGAVGRNPISILIPCHRVVGADGGLTGYGGGLAAKRALLKLEGAAGF
jgi:methylated-DNA-[protein]-cysteine S-methyltransferase